MDELVWTRIQAAARLKISVRKLDMLRAANVLPSFTIGDRRFYRESDLQAFVASQIIAA